MGKKKIKTLPSTKTTKNIVCTQTTSSNHLHPVWRFDMLDRTGEFAFDYTSPNFRHQEVLCKLIEYGNMTWGEIKLQTHDKKNKAKHHYLDVTKLSFAAMQRIKAKHLEEETDALFSLALQNKLRIIGVLRHDVFHMVWYDTEHQFCPSTK